MNQLAPISYEDRAKAKAMEVRRRLMGTPKRVNIIKDVLVQLAEKKKVSGGKIMSADADSHVVAYRQWQERAFKRTTMMEYAEKLCADLGTSLAQVRTRDRTRVLVSHRDSVTFDLRQRFLHKPLTEIGKVIDRDHSSLVYSLRRESQRRGVKIGAGQLAITSKAFPTLEDDLKSGMAMYEIAEKYDVAPSTISRKVKALGLMDLLQSKTKPASVEFIASLREEYEDGIALRKIAKKYKVSIRSVTNWKTEFGWDRKARAE